jgi:uncharacterized membrane protein SpoIIM required for sporulation
MIELLFSPKQGERKPWQMFFVGLFYASVSLLLVSFVFSQDGVLKNYGGMLVVLLTVISSLPFMYYLIKGEENKDVEITKGGRLLREHMKATLAFMFLFCGFVVAFSFWYIVLPSQVGVNFNAQVEVFCAINNPHNYEYCVSQYLDSAITGAVSASDMVVGIFSNNIYVLIFTILFSLAFGAGAIFILAWNASVIAVAIGILAGKVTRIPWGFARYMLIHGIPEIAAYFIGALAGGIISIAVIRKDMRGERMWRILQDALILVIIAVALLVLAALLEVFVIPKLF